MKKIIFLLLISFSLFACSCEKERELNNEEIEEVLLSIKYVENTKVKITTIVNNTTTEEEDYYFNDLYYHSSKSSTIESKTWYGYINNDLYALYYTKVNGIESKHSSLIDLSTLEEAKNGQIRIINSLMEDNSLNDEYAYKGTKKGDNIKITVNNDDASCEINITKNKLDKIVLNGSASSSSTYEYSYDIEKITLPTLSEYPLAS